MEKKQPGIEWIIGLLTLTIVTMAFFLFKPDSFALPSFISIPKLSQDTNLLAIFLTGLFVGGLSCLAVQGGLLAATLAQGEEEKLKDKMNKSGNALPIASFLLAKLVAYTILGFLLGSLGSAFQLSLTAKVVMQFAVAIFMIGTALNLLNVHPIFRYFVISPPRFLTKLVRKQSKQSSLFAPVLLGAFTVFIPCGTTQAMMALSIGSASPFMGAAILAAFVLGTSPLFFVLGYFATKLGDALHQRFIRIAAFALILLAIFNANNALALTGGNFTLENIWQGMFKSTSAQNSENQMATEATINIGQAGYSPSNLSIKAGALITLHL
ncbi:MAG: sulfite exporter TauE/SafE family protein, partial [Patescibacteria group bacterium]